MPFPSATTLTAMILALAATLAGSEREPIANLLNKAYRKQEMIQRVFFSGSTIRYSADGEFLSGGKPGPWTLDAEIECTGVRLKQNKLVIKGKRLYFLYDKKQQILKPWYGPDVEIDIMTGAGLTSISSLQKAISKVFISGDEESAFFVPDYWKDYLLNLRRHHSLPEEKRQSLLEEKMSAIPASSIGGITGGNNEALQPVRAATNPSTASAGGKYATVTRPEVIYKIEPPYTPEARSARINGVVILSADIGPNGYITSLSIIRPLGMGLDDNAAQAVQAWRFKPATREGKPVPAKVSIEISFKISRMH
jgi:TonB family protein